MPSALFALMAGIAFAGAEILNKRGLQNTSILLGFLVSLASGLLLLFFVLLINPPTSVNWRGTSWFVLAGLVGPGVGRLVGIAAAHRLGPSLSTPIQSIAYPLLALSLSFILLRTCSLHEGNRRHHHRHGTLAPDDGSYFFDSFRHAITSHLPPRWRRDLASLDCRSLLRSR